MFPPQQQHQPSLAPSTTQVVQFPVAALLTQLGSVKCCCLKGPLICPAVIHQQLLKPLKPLFIIFNACWRPHSAFLFCSLFPSAARSLSGSRWISFSASLHRVSSLKTFKSIFLSQCSGVHVFRAPRGGERSGRFQGSAWLFLPEGFRGSSD